MDTKLLIIIFAVLGLITLIGIFWSVKTETRLKRFFRGKKGQDLEAKIDELEESIKRLDTLEQKLEASLKEVNQKLRKSIRGVELIRFNPFPDQGGNQSFAVSLMNEDGDGVVMSSLYSRERMSVFAKPIKNGTSTYELSSEEQDVVEKAKVR